MPHATLRRRVRLLLVGATIAGTLAIAVGTTVTGSQGGLIERVRNATAKYHDLAVAERDGFGAFYLCTDSGDGAMGQHFVNGARVGDPSLSETSPEILVYAPTPGGGYRLVGVEYVVIAAAWDETHDSAPVLFGRTLKRVPEGNRYGLPDFYELHAWIWRPNPRGMFDDWNSKVSCLGNGDPA